MTRWITFGLMTIFFAAPAMHAQAPETGTPAYVNENQTDPNAISLREVTGVVRGLGGDAIPRAAVSVFAEQGHTFITTAMTDREGKFKFDKLEHGLYRVIVKVPGLCPANIPVKLEGSLLAHRKLVVTMRPKGIDTCSYGMTK